MFRKLIAIVALLAALPAAAQELKSYTADFDAFATSTTAMPPVERVKAFRDRFNALIPGFYQPRFGATEEKYDTRIQKALESYPADRAKFLAAASSFATAYAAANVHFRRFFPDYVPPATIYLLHSIGEMDGGTRDIGGKTYAVFGADVIAKVHDASTIGPFLDHELFHFHHARYFADCEALWCSLWQEGLATYVAGQMNPGGDDRTLMLVTPRPIRPEVEPRLDEAMCFTRAKLDSTDQGDYAAFFFGDGKSRFPPRFGYFIGYLLAKQIGATMSLDSLARLPPARVKPLLEAALAGYACPAAS